MKENIIVLAVLAVILAAAIIYVVRAKKKGVKCIGCPAGGNCSKKTEADSSGGCGCGCCGSTEEK